MIILFGDPGAGKGTQAEILADKLGYGRISTGDLIREEMKKQSELAKEMKPFYDAGTPAPNQIVNKLVGQKIENLIKNKTKGIVSDTFPFDDEQSEFLKQISPKYNLADPIIFWIDVPDGEILKRLSKRLICGKCNKIFFVGELKENDKCPKCDGVLKSRSDDSRDVIKKRIKVYQKEEKSHRKYYKNYGIWFDINGNQPIESVAAEIWSKLNNY